MKVTSTDKNLAISNRSSWTRSEKRRWVGGLFITNIFVYASRNLMSICIMALAKQEGWNKKQAGWALASFFWGYPLTQIIGGRCGDKYGAELTVSMACLVWSTLTFLTPLLLHSWKSFSTLQILVLLRMFIGLSQGFHFPGLSSLMGSKVASNERAFYNTVLNSGTYVGILMVGLMGPFIIDVLNWQWNFYFIGGCSLIWLVIFYIRVISKYRSAKSKQSSKEVDNRLMLPLLEGSKSTPSTAVPWALLIKSPPVIALLVGRFCEAYAFWNLFSWLPTYFHDNYPDAKPWVFNVLPWMLNIFVSILSGLLADKLIQRGYSVTFARKLLSGTSFMGVTISFIALNFAHTSFSAIICMTTAIMFCCLHSTGIILIPQDIAPNHAGVVHGMANMAAAIPGLIGVYISGYILETTKSWAIVFNVAAGVSQIGFFTFMIFGSAEQLI